MELTRQKLEGPIEMIYSSAGEVTHLFEIMKKYGVRCSLELNTNDSANSLISIAQAAVKVDYLEGDTVVIHLDEAEFAFDLENHCFGKYVSDCQIDICISSEHYVAWFNSGTIPEEGIEEASHLSNEYKDEYCAIEMTDKQAAAEELVKVAGLLRNGWNVCECSFDSTEDTRTLYLTMNNSQ
ncbi:hypothetical protein P9314_17985 [Paenibacillus validus]|uniref:hypothetical protein n=1 Tax=Paenibacillus validus TaxID=44253 RepID=UPI000FDC697E|nr:hypothetical protein [Paenibacillus validus]MED4602559.1 hypothetical protein [Paenibacillus validus]MED4606084.1 hypothetical protein [Paenibacillus validus]